MKKSPLELEDIAKLINCCRDNAESLLEDAILLLENGRYARSLSLSILSTEEIAKIPMLTTAATFKKDEIQLWKGFWKRFYSHRSKQRMFSWMLFLLNKEAKFDDTFEELALQKLIETFKELGFYVDILGDKVWFPNKISKTLAERGVAIAKQRIKTHKKYFKRDVTEDELMKLSKIEPRLVDLVKNREIGFDELKKFIIDMKMNIHELIEKIEKN